MSTVSLPYGKQSIDSTDLQSTAKILSSEWITRGPETVNFEKYIAQKVGATYAVTFNSGSSALAASYYAGDLSTYDKVITSSNTFIATISPALRKGCPLYFPDIDPNTGAVDINRL